MQIGDDRAAHRANASLGRARERPLLPPQPLHRRLPDLLEGHAARAARAESPHGPRSLAEAGGARSPGSQQFRGPYATAGPYDRDGERVEVRLEKVPGGVRLAEWARGALQRARARAARGRPARPGRAGARARAPARARPRQARDGGRRGALRRSRPGGARARAGRATSREELRVEAVGDGDVRVARWILRPGAEWELQDAPPMLPAARFAEALAAARRAARLARVMS